MKPWSLFAVGLFLSLFCVGSSAEGAEDNLDLDTIVARSGKAMGYGDDFQNLKTLKFDVHRTDRERVIEWEILRPRFVRKNFDRGVILVFDGKRSAFLAGPRGEDGKLKEPSLVPEEDWHHFEMDIALYVPAYFDYPAEYHGVHEFEGKSAHRISVKLPMGGTVVYLVDSKTYLPLSIRLPGWEYEVAPEDWVEIEGVKVYRISRCISHPDHNQKLEQLQVNSAIDSSRFAIPETMKPAE